MKGFVTTCLQTCNNLCVFTCVGDLSVDLSIFFTVGVSTDSVSSSLLISIPEDEGAPYLPYSDNSFDHTAISHAPPLGNQLSAVGVSVVK